MPVEQVTPQTGNATTLDGIDSTAFEQTANKDANSGYLGLNSGQAMNKFVVTNSSRTGAVTLGATGSTLNRCDATSAAFTVTLPAASARNGVVFIFTKTDSSANAVTIQRAGSDTIAGATSIALSQQYQYVVLVSDGTSVWQVFAMGIASTNGAVKVPLLTSDPASPAPGEMWGRTADAFIRYVPGTGGSANQLEIKAAKDIASGYVGLDSATRLTSASTRFTTNTSLTGTTTLTVSSNTVQKGDASGGAFTVTLPAASLSGRIFIIKKADSSGNAITISRAGSDTIDGATSYSLSAQYQSVTLIADGGTGWMVV